MGQYYHPTMIDENGNINWNSSENDKHYAKGKYKFALFEQSGWHQTTNMNNIHPNDTFYGYQYLEVGDQVDETEFSIDTKALAKHLGLDLTQSAELKVLFHRVGREPLIASGISTGPGIRSWKRKSRAWLSAKTPSPGISASSLRRKGKRSSGRLTGICSLPPVPSAAPTTNSSPP